MRGHVLEVDARDPRVRHVVDEEPPAVVVTVRLGEARVVRVAPQEPAQHGLGFLVEAVPARGLGGEDRDRGDVAARGKAVHEDLAGVAAGQEGVVGIILARLHVHLLRRRSAASAPRTAGPKGRRDEDEAQGNPTERAFHVSTSLAC